MCVGGHRSAWLFEVVETMSCNYSLMLEQGLIYVELRHIQYILHRKTPLLRLCGLLLPENICY